MSAADAPRRPSGARQAHEDLLRGMIAGHEDLWATSAYFRKALEDVARLAPMFVDSIATAARLAEAADASLQRILDQGPGIHPGLVHTVAPNGPIGAR